MIPASGEAGRGDRGRPTITTNREAHMSDMSVVLESGMRYDVENTTGTDDVAFARKSLREGVVVEDENDNVLVFHPSQIRNFVIRRG